AVAGRAEFLPNAGQVGVDQLLVPLIICWWRPALADHGEIGHGVRDPSLAQQPGRLAGDGGLAYPDGPGDQQDRHRGSHTVGDSHTVLRDRSSRSVEPMVFPLVTSLCIPHTRATPQ